MNPRFRRLLAISDSTAGRQRVVRWLGRLPDAVERLWIGTHAPEGVAQTRPAQVGHWLGRERDVVVFEANEPLAVDALAIAAGLLRGGGMLLLLVGPAGSGGAGAWERRWYRALRQAPVEWLGKRWEDWPRPITRRVIPESFSWTGDQQAARALLQGLEPGECGVLVAARGRGKSTLLGDWMAQRLQDGAPAPVLTAPTRGAVRAVHAAVQSRLGRLPEALRYRAPASLEAAVPNDFLVVDEAAALPVERLLRLAGRVRRLVLATTTGGFEGSGQGFRLRVLPALEAAGFRVRRASLQTPVRWGCGDPLERWINDLFLLDARSAEPAPQAVCWHWEPAAALGRQPRRLEAVTGLLADAHYRTRPSDLRRWLEDPSVRLLTLAGERDSVLFGAVLVGEEPGLDSALARAVWAGERRPQGHFLPCVLAGLGAFDLAALPVWRIQRIAVHPAWQGRGLGLRLLHAVLDRARAEGIGWLGVSFGLDHGLLGLWRRGGFQLLRVGLQPDPYSGRPGGVMLRAVDVRRAAALEYLVAAQARDWPVWRDHLWPSSEASLAAALGMLHSAPAEAPAPAQDVAEIRAFALRARPLEWALPALLRQLHTRSSMLDASAEPAQALRACLQAPIDWDHLAQRLGVSGRRGVVRQLRRLARAWCAAA